MMHAGNNSNNKNQNKYSTFIISLLFVWPRASTSETTNTTKRSQTQQLLNTLSQIAGSNVSGRENQTPYQLPSITRGILWWWQGSKLHSLGSTTGLELKSCQRPSCVDQPVWAFGATLLHGTRADLLGIQTLVWIQQQGDLSLRLCFTCLITCCLLECVFIFLRVLCNPDAIMLFTHAMAI